MCAICLLWIFILLSFLAPYDLHIPKMLQLLISGEIPHEIMTYPDMCNITPIVLLVSDSPVGDFGVSRVTWFDRHG